MRPRAFGWHPGLAKEILVAALVTVVAGGLTLAASNSGFSPVAVLAAATGAIVAGWLLVTSRYEWSFIIVLLYLGLADGYLKLSTGSRIATLGRDVVIYTIVGGAIVRLLAKREAIAFPPLTGWVIGFVALVGVEILNPGGSGISNSLAATRQHIEFVPLFFAGYAILTSTKRLRVFFLLLAGVATVNGLVSAYQISLTPAELADWGPGYSAFIFGTGNVSGRTFLTLDGVSSIRPFGLGSDVGFGGAVGLIAAPGILAVLGLLGRRKAAIPALVLAAGVVLAVVTSQGRAAVMGTVVSIAALVILGVTSRQSLRPLIAVGLLVGIAAILIPVIVADNATGTFDRYTTIAPTNAVDYAYTYRIDDLSLVPGYIREFPLGTGLGTIGPAAGSRGVEARFNGETNFGFLVIELGLPGLLLLLAFSVRVIWLAVTRIRRLLNSETRLLLAGLTAPLVGILISWIIGPALATPPFAPYFWFASGALAFWLSPAGRADSASQPIAR